MRVLNHSNSYKNRRKSFVTLIIIFLILSLHGPSSIAMLIDISQIKDMDNSVNDKYIIKFNEEPLSIFENRVKTEMKNLFPYLTEKASFSNSKSDFSGVGGIVLGIIVGSNTTEGLGFGEG